MKTKAEQNTPKKELESLNAKPAELTCEEMEPVTGGIAYGRTYWTGRSGKKNNGTSDDDSGSEN